MISTRVGYSGGETPNPTYRNHGNHAESVEIVFDSLWPGKVVTEVTAAGPFWEAEDQHQDYLQKYPEGYNCHYVRPDWKLPHRESKAAGS